ncbi:MAG: hypothetical protein GX963_09980 [Bacteroidales bacterium]|nr:hypothetical protein [Bacteroidales bacterium]
MEKTIKKVQDYFKNKIVSGDYRVVNKTKYAALLLIDNKYHFVIWIANGVFGLKNIGDEVIFKNNRSPFNVTIYNFIHLSFTDKEKEIIYKGLTSRRVSKLRKKKELREIAVA